MTTDERMPWEVFWNGGGMLVIEQEQSGPLRMGLDKKPALVFEPEELPKLIDELRQAAADGVEMLGSEISVRYATMEKLTRVSE